MASVSTSRSTSSSSASSEPLEQIPAPAPILCSHFDGVHGVLQADKAPTFLLEALAVLRAARRARAVGYDPLPLMCPKKIAKRTFSVQLCKSKKCYRKYRALVPLSERSADMPHTPRADEPKPTREWRFEMQCWDQALKQWQ